MRTTVTLDADVAAAVEQLRRAEHLGLSEAVNRLARAGLRRQPRRHAAPASAAAFAPADLGMLVDVSNIGDVLAQLDEADDTLGHP